MEGKLTINRLGNDPKVARIVIRIEDKSSGVEFVEAEVGFADFTLALTGQAFMPVDFVLRGADKVGKQLEVKTIEVAIPPKENDFAITGKDVREAVAKHEVDGWEGSDKDARNHHNRVYPDSGCVSGSTYRVHYHRYV